MKKTANVDKIRRERDDLTTLLESLPSNPIAWLPVIKIVAPIIARLAVRMALKRLRRDLSEEKVNQIGREVGTTIRAITGLPVTAKKK